MTQEQKRRRPRLPRMSAAAAEIRADAMNVAAPDRSGKVTGGNGVHAPPRPTALPVLFDQIPLELRQGRQLVVWRYEWRNGHWTKPPFQPNGRNADSTDPETWCTIEEATAAYLAGGWDG